MEDFLTLPPPPPPTQRIIVTLDNVIDNDVVLIKVTEIKTDGNINMLCYTWQSNTNWAVRLSTGSKTAMHLGSFSHVTFFIHNETGKITLLLSTASY